MLHLPQEWVLCIIISREEEEGEFIAKNDINSGKIDEYVVNFEKEFSLVSYLSTSTIIKSAWYLDSSVSRHKTKGWDLFRNFMEKDLRVHVDCGDDVMHARNGEGTIKF